LKKQIFTPTDILLPKLSEKDMEAWAVIACDQFSSEKDYWKRVKKLVGDRPSTFEMIIPEAYLEEVEQKAETQKICDTMRKYTNSDVLETIENSFIYVERTLPDGRTRKGIVGAVDLEEYDFTGAASAIRASEGTALDRLPPRVAVRRVASLELPHIITFIDDKEKKVIEPLSDMDNLPTLYEFYLMEGGGAIKGKKVTGECAQKVMDALNLLHENSDMLMIMGDGNHSLAAAKVYWDEIKQKLSDSERENHPARRALVEVSNVYDTAIDFEAIHRVIFSTDAATFITEFTNAMPKGNDYVIKWITNTGSGEISIAAECIGDLYGLMQEFVDEFTARSGGTIDYIHGDDTTKKLAKQEGAVGLILPAMDKSEFFETVTKRGVFPRKSFSVGHARDKRYYLECRRITHSL